jgi:hypothetical protein
MKQDRRGKVRIISGSKILAGSLCVGRDFLQKYSGLDTGSLDVCCLFFFVHSSSLTVCSTNVKI